MKIKKKKKEKKKYLFEIVCLVVNITVCLFVTGHAHTYNSLRNA